MRKILSISLEIEEKEYIIYLACFYNITVSEYIRKILREKWEDDKFESYKEKFLLIQNEKHNSS